MSKRTKTRSRKGDRELLLHTQRAMSERYNHILSPEQYAHLGEMIRACDGTMIVRQTNTRTVWKLTPVWCPVPIYAVYQKPLSAVCTVLMEYMVKQMVEQGDLDERDDLEAA